jgi:uncharacterized membrane protein
MRSWLNALVLLAACGNDVDPSCQTSRLTYENFGAVFLENWCNGCHSDGLPYGMRQTAPLDVNFDTLDEVRAQSFAIVRTTAIARTMPPEGGPTEDERALLAEWMQCGAAP